MPEISAQPGNQLGHNSKKKLIIILLAIILLVALVWSIISIIWSRDNDHRATAKRQAKINATIAEIKAVDYDFDDLSDRDESLLGTDPANEDTDADGILDGQEVSLYGTDPLNPDTDGDGKDDGFEILYRQNPKIKD